jgi:hypothetical protein
MCTYLLHLVRGGEEMARCRVDVDAHVVPKLRWLP